MYAIVTTGGKQYKVAKGDTIAVEKLDIEPGKTVDLDVIFIADGSKVTTDADAVKKAKVYAEVIEHFKGDKALVFKFKKRKGYKRLNGHRQELTRLLVKDVSLTGDEPKKKAAPKKTAKPKEADEAVVVKAAEPKAKKAEKPVDTAKAEKPVEAKKAEKPAESVKAEEPKKPARTTKPKVAAADSADKAEEKPAEAKKPARTAKPKAAVEDKDEKKAEEVKKPARATKPKAAVEDKEGEKAVKAEKPAKTKKEEKPEKAE